jgi:hypothetical protein
MIEFCTYISLLSKMINLPYVVKGLYSTIQSRLLSIEYLLTDFLLFLNFNSKYYIGIMLPVPVEGSVIKPKGVKNK